MKSIDQHILEQRNAMPAAPPVSIGAVSELAGIMADLAGLQARIARFARNLSMDSVVIGAEEENPRVPASPAQPTQKDRVLGLYASTLLNPAGIARETGIKPSSVGAYLSMGRKAKDRRVVEGDAARAVARQAGAPPAPKDDRDEDFATAVAATLERPAPRAERKPAPVPAEPPARLRLPSAPPPPRVLPKAAPAPSVSPPPEPPADWDPDIIMLVHVEAQRIDGPLGELPVSPPFALTMERLQDGGVYDNKSLQALGGWPSEGAMKEHFRIMRPKLARIGVDLVEVNKFMTKVRRTGAAA
ncbi:hypothetical protein GGR34_003718 [Microvirga flocculans]|uniref:Uncharacterized protein n=1 Tax=Microvirga flocculans TaxID=217168 RepID=A0A7W6NA18_9HYPH|nr:hypothetical protein [Microvirga flocculans]MBB4042033.1 hypothetical protein [Microvirga flocculans]